LASLSGAGGSGDGLGDGVILVEDLSQQRSPARSLAAVLRQAGIPVRLVSFSGAADAVDMVQAVRVGRSGLVVISQLFAHLLAEHLDLVRTLRGQGVGGHITMVGPLPNFAWADLLKDCPALDSVLTGEAEAGIVALARAVTLGGGWEGVPGLVWRSPELRRNLPDGGGLSLDELPLPVYDDALPGGDGVRFATIEASRGCYHVCAFCLPRAAQRQAGQAYRMRLEGSLGEEMEARYRAGARLFLFDDEQFLAPLPLRESRVDALEQELTRRGLEIAFTIKCRADDVTPALFQQLRRMGLLRVYLGLESGWQPCLDLLNKGTRVEQNARALQVLASLDIVADFRCLLFHPWSTLETIRAELAGLAALADDLTTLLDFRELEVYPGTAVARRMAAEGRPVAALAPWAYTIADPAAELLRRLCRVVFGASGPLEAARERVTQAWFRQLLSERFAEVGPTEDRESLIAEVRCLNAACLGLWDEMVRFAGSGRIADADAVNERAAEWSARLGMACLASELDHSPCGETR
jgi:anaerobic magnesium-protoporphyrin IX monomethyl ester cyclase